MGLDITLKNKSLIVDPKGDANLENALSTKIVKIFYNQIINFSITPQDVVVGPGQRQMIDFLDLADSLKPNRSIPHTYIDAIIDETQDPAVFYTGTQIDTARKCFDIIESVMD